MSYNNYTRSTLGPTASSAAPLRQDSTASTASSVYTNYSNPFAPSRTSTVSSAASALSQYSAIGHKRGISDTITSEPISPEGHSLISNDASPSEHKSLRSSLRPLPQAPAPSYMQDGSVISRHTPEKSMDKLVRPYGGSSLTPDLYRTSTVSRSDSVRGSGRGRTGRSTGHAQYGSPALLEKPNLHSLQHSATRHLRTLSKFAEDGAEEDFTINSPEQEVVGMHGRRKLQRAKSTRVTNTVAVTGYGGRTWMDQQRQFLQAYEYLCHIGEAKEWIEDVIKKTIPPIVELEEALRDGVTLAEVVQALHPEQTFRIFRSSKLQFRHSDNIALFFRFLSSMELPELFRFELVDLYDKKNIPKVIYCIHALSWLLYRKGKLDFRIGNLVGQLQFEDHELEATQKGLDKAGVSMPNFSGMGANFGEPERPPEPVETEAERIDRELHESEAVYLDLQAQVRGALVRLQLGDTMQQLWDDEHLITQLQSFIRGDWTRQIFQYRMDMKSFATNLQTAAKGFLVRKREQERGAYWHGKEKEITVVQSFFRSRQVRCDQRRLKVQLQHHQNGIREFQAAIKGALQRWQVGEDYYATREAEGNVQGLQATIRGFLARKAIRRTETGLIEAQLPLTILQAHMRAAKYRTLMQADQETLSHQSTFISSLQAHSRAKAKRSSLNNLSQELQDKSRLLDRLQATIRGCQSRSRLSDIRALLAEQAESVTSSQAAIRGFLSRGQVASDLKALDDHDIELRQLQSAVRGYLLRQKVFELLCDLQDGEAEIAGLQGLARAMLERASVGALLNALENEEPSIIDFQRSALGKIVRDRFAEKKRYYNENMQKVVKIQSFVRARQQGEAYKSLTSGQNPPVGTIKNFVHLLNDSDFDFEEEIEFEQLRKTVVQHVRQNEMAEQYIDQLDIKIALLVKNKITLDEVVKHQRHFGGHVSGFLTNKEFTSKDPFDLKALNKNSRRKLEHYQELFFILQTQPQYLARLFKNIREQGTAEKECKRIELLMMGLFGFAQKRREEYYLLKLMVRSIKEEIDGCFDLQDYLRGNFFWFKIFTGYIRSPRDRKFLRELLGPLIKENIIENEGLDLESDPIQIYRSAINNEELRTGQRSRRIPDIPREEAIRDPETRETFIHHLQDLRDIADQFFASLEDQLHRMPFGVRYIAQQTFELLCAKFQYEDRQHLLQVVGHWVWKSYLLNSLTQPESWGVVDRGLSPQQKRNLGEVAKVLGQVSVGRLFGGENIYLQPLNSYVSEAIERLQETWTNLVTVKDAESQFDIDEYNDLYARTKPTIYIKLVDIFAVHQFIATDIATLCPSQNDILRELIRELGSAKTNENELQGVSSSEITLTLNPKFHDVQDSEAAIKALFMETKRCILYIIRVQSGANLLEIMVRPISPEDEDKWELLLREELVSGNGSRRGAYCDATTPTLTDIPSLSYTELKRTALENLIQLESAGRVSRHNHYQDLLNAIAVDIRTKHRRRVQRAREVEGVRATLAALDEKSGWLDQQLQSYNDYIEQAMVTLQRTKGKKRFIMPFTKQYNHERELARSGKVPKFGSFKYSARTLAEKGVLVSWTGYPETKWDKVNLTISSDEIGVFHIEGSAGSMMIPGASASVPLDDLLQAQFNNCQFMNLFGGHGNGNGNGHGGAGGDGSLRLNVNLFLHLVFKKFYRDE